MKIVTTRSKYVPETIPIPLDFGDMLPSGSSIVGLPTVTVSVLSGVDLSPSAILYLGVSVFGTVVSQRFRQGVVGAIYLLTYTVSDGTQDFIKETALAILPLDASATPDSQYLILTSQLYPLEEWERYTSFIQPQSGNFWYNPTTLEKYQSFITTADGAFWLAQLFYTYGGTYEQEQFRSFISPQDGLLTPTGSPSYTNAVEKFQSAFAPLAGTFVLAQVFYTCHAEMFTSSISPQAGTLA